jgi:hypothetical protein
MRRGSVGLVIGCRYAFLVLVIAFSIVGTLTAQSEHVTRAFVGEDGLIHILNADGREFVATKEDNPYPDLRKDPGANQESVGIPKIAADGRTVGWIVNFGNCCTSYPIPLMLVIYRDGKVLQRLSAGDWPMIWDWHFVAGGKQVEISTGPLHGEGGGSERYVVATGQLIHRHEANLP